jgi:hypothetical protein
MDWLDCTIPRTFVACRACSVPPFHSADRFLPRRSTPVVHRVIHDHCTKSPRLIPLFVLLLVGPRRWRSLTMVVQLAAHVVVVGSRE